MDDIAAKNGLDAQKLGRGQFIIGMIQLSNRHISQHGA